MRVNRQSRLNYRLQTIVFVLLLTSATGLLAWLSNTYSLRYDWTYNNRNSLSDATVTLLKTIDGAVDIRSYQNADPVMMQAVREILQRYRHHKPDLQFHILNPDLDLEQAKADRISVYGQTVIEYRERRESVETLSEYGISNALIRLSRKRSPKLVFSTGHGERAPDNDNNVGYTLLKNKLQEKGFQVNTVNLLSEDIPEDATSLIIAAPDHPFHAGEVEKITRFVSGGGHLLWLQDPGDRFGLQSLAELLGIEFIAGVVVDNNPTLRETLRIQHPAVVPVISYHEHDITEDMRYNTLFPIAGALEFKTVEGWKTSPLLATLPGSWSETDGFVLDVAFEEERGDRRGPLNLGLAMERKIDNTSQRVVIMGDSDFLANTYLGAGANLTLGLNIFNWLSEDDELIAIEPREAPDLRLEMDDTRIAVIGFGFLAVLPLLLIGSGLWIWIKRRNR